MLSPHRVIRAQRLARKGYGLIGAQRIPCRAPAVTHTLTHEAIDLCADLASTDSIGSGLTRDRFARNAHEGLCAGLDCRFIQMQQGIADRIGTVRRQPRDQRIDEERLYPVEKSRLLTVGDKFRDLRWRIEGGAFLCLAAQLVQGATSSLLDELPDLCRLFRTGDFLIEGPQGSSGFGRHP